MTLKRSARVSAGVEPTALRILLLLGLVIHKVVWEAMKRRDYSPAAGGGSSDDPLQRGVRLVKVLLLAFLVLQTVFLDAFPIVRRPSRLPFVGAVVYILGLSLAIAARLQLGRNWSNLEDSQILPEQSLVTSGVYRYVRHPIYMGDLLLLLGLELALNSWLVLGVAAPAIVVAAQARKEEAILARSFGGYETYRKQTKMFIPFLL
jgi:protein-S-isoprenylcysteine O-methyltransferase Ste14